MSITLCHKCFPNTEGVEEYTTQPLGPCEQCGKSDIATSGSKMYLGESSIYPKDPRPRETHIVEKVPTIKV